MIQTQDPSSAWYILDVFHQVHGPFSSQDVRRLAAKNSNFYVGRQEMDEWHAVSSIPDFIEDDGPRIHKETLDTPHELQRALDELMGICKGIISDGVVTPQETVYLNNWLDKNRAISRSWPADVLCKRVGEVLADGRVDPEEQQELLELLQMVTGEAPQPSQAQKVASLIPYDNPEPDLVFNGRTFCLTGKFVYGTRAQCEHSLANMGSRCVSSPGLDCDYLVVGTLGHSDWVRSVHGKKIQKALELKKQGAVVAIVSEEWWTAHMVDWK